MAPAPYTYAEIIRREAEWKRNPYPTDNVISDLREMIALDPTLFTGPDGIRALHHLEDAERNNLRPAFRQGAVIDIQLVFDKLKLELNAKNPDEARLRRMYAAPVPAPVPAPAPVPVPAPAPPFGVMAPVQAAPAPPAANLFGFLAPQRPAFPPRNGGRRRTRRGRKSRRKSLRQRK